MKKIAFLFVILVFISFYFSNRNDDKHNELVDSVEVVPVYVEDVTDSTGTTIDSVEYVVVND